MKWDVFDCEGKWLGTIHGQNETDALKNAVVMGMETAAKVEEKDEPIYPHGRG